MQLGADHVRVRVPATSANLGPGFDAFGIALAHYDEIDVIALAEQGARVEVEGEGAGELPDGEKHLIVRALRTALEIAGAPQLGLRLSCVNRIPHGRGLGSSAAAVVAGIAAARALVADPAAIDDATALALATEFEGHPDNAAPALLGGATIAWTSGTPGREGPRAVRFDVHPDIEATALVPRARLATRDARDALPYVVRHEDAAFNAGRAGLLTYALCTDPGLLFEATEDRLHQDYRASAMAESVAVVAELRSAGVPAFISGAGPTVLVLAPAADRAGVAAAVDRALPGAGWRIERPQVDRKGVVTERIGANDGWC